MSQLLQSFDQLTGQPVGLQALQEVRTQLVVGRAALQHVVHDHQQRVTQGHQRTASCPVAPPTVGTAPTGTSPWCGWPPRPPAPASAAASDSPWSSCRSCACRRSRCCPGTSPPTTPGGRRWGTAPCPRRSPPAPSPPPAGRPPGSSPAVPPPPQKGRGPPRSRMPMRPINSSRCVTWSRCIRSRKRWWSVTRPCNATRSSGIFSRRRLRARSASFAGSVSPAISASSMSRPETPSTSVATPASLMLASSSTFWMRLAAADRSWINCVRCRVRSRNSRIGCGGTKLARSRPCCSSWAIHCAVLDVGLAAGHLLDVLGVDQDDADVALQEVEDRLPVDAGRFHRHVRDAVAGQPVRQGQQVAGHGREGADLLEDLAGAVGSNGRRRRRCSCGRRCRRSGGREYP